MQRLSDRVAIVTGGTGGLGKEVVSKFLEEGAKVFSTYTRKEGLEACKVLRDEYKSSLIFGKADVTKENHMSKVVAKTVEIFDKVDLLVNVVGGFMSSSLVDTDLDTWNKMMDMNLKSTFVCSKAVLPGMIEQDYGRIVNIAARPALHGYGGVSAYGASKAGVINLTESMADEVKEHNINVNAIIPGTMDTPGNRKAMPDADFSKWVHPSEIAQIITFLCSEHASSITGATIPVYGKS